MSDRQGPVKRHGSDAVTYKGYTIQAAPHEPIETGEWALNLSLCGQLKPERKVGISTPAIGTQRKSMRWPTALPLANRSLMERFPDYRLANILIGPQPFKVAGT